MKDTEVKKLLYQDSEAFKVGYEAGFAKACEMLHDFADLVSKMREAQKVYSEMFPTDYECYAPTELECKVDGISPFKVVSIATAFLSVLARLLKIPSIMWCAFEPESCLTCKVAPAL